METLLEEIKDELSRMTGEIREELSSMPEHLRGQWSRMTEAISKYHDEPIFLPESYIKGTLLPAVFTITAVLTIIYLITCQFVHKIVPADADAVKKSKVCYQITNVLFNIAVGSLGLYIEYWILPNHHKYTGPSYERATGLTYETYLLSAMQLGYQLWAIPVGVFYVHESFEMIMHHMAVVVSTSMSGFLTIGFRYYVSFFYGVMELSSIPLSIMNSIKGEPQWMRRFPNAFHLSRVIFALSFLFIRVYLCAYRWPIFLRDNFIVLYTREMDLFKAYLFVQFSLASLLAYLQLFWAMLILRGILKMFLGKPKTE